MISNNYNPDADIFYGEVMNLADVITFQGRRQEYQPLGSGHPWPSGRINHV